MVVTSIFGLLISFGRPMVFDSLFQKMSQNLPVYLQRYPPLPPCQNETASMVPNSKPPLPPQNETANRVPNLRSPSLPKMKLPIGAQFETPLNMNTTDSLAFMFIPIYLRLAGNIPPP